MAITATGACLALFSSSLCAEYLVNGPIEGNVCWGIGFQVCGLKRLDAVSGKDGKLYTITERFDSVSEYKPETGRCWIRTKNTNLGLISFAVNAVTQPEFFEKDSSGEYKKHDVEYVTFKCVKR